MGVCGGNADDVAGGIVVIDTVGAAGNQVGAGRNHEIEARAKFRIHVIGATVGVERLRWQAAIKLQFAGDGGPDSILSMLGRCVCRCMYITELKKNPGKNDNTEKDQKNEWTPVSHCSTSSC